MNNQQSIKTDVLILGGGPAGTSTAIELAKLGYKVVVLERSDYKTIRIGETLPPMIRNPLMQLGVWQQFQNDNHILCPGIMSVWGNEYIYENDFIVNPYGYGWHVDRCRFDETLANVAQQIGAYVYRSVQISKCSKLASKNWQVEFTSENKKFQLTANFLVEATGRLGSPVSQIRSKKIFYDKLVGVVKIFDSSKLEQDCRTLIEASEHGWWYSAYLPNNRLIVAYMADGDQIPKKEKILIEHWIAQLNQTSYTWQRFAHKLTVGTSKFRIVAANSYQKVNIVGENYLVVGDAATTFDPLSAQGIFKALVFGIQAAKTISNYQQHGKDALNEYEETVKKDFKLYLQAKINYYSREQRWNNSQFWKRRHSVDSSVG